MSDRVPPISVQARLQARLQPEMRSGDVERWTALPVLLWVDDKPQFMMVPAIAEDIEGHTVFTMSPVSAGPEDTFVQSSNDLSRWTTEMGESNE